MMTADELPRPKVRHPEVSPDAEYRLLRVVVTAITLGRTMVIAQNDATDPEVVLAQGRMDEALTVFTKHLKALEAIAAGQLTVGDASKVIVQDEHTTDAGAAPCRKYTPSEEGRTQ
jgi:hypothetical protein